MPCGPSGPCAPCRPCSPAGPPGPGGPSGPCGPGVPLAPIIETTSGSGAHLGFPSLPQIKCESDAGLGGIRIPGSFTFHGSVECDQASHLACSWLPQRMDDQALRPLLVRPPPCVNADSHCSGLYHKLELCQEERLKVHQGYPADLAPPHRGVSDRSAPFPALRMGDLV